MAAIDVNVLPLSREFANAPSLGIVTGIFRAPPAMTRLEPKSASGDPAPGVAMAIHDPMWLLARQWQFAEFAGEDAGTPLIVQLEGVNQRVDRWKPRNGASRPLPEGGVLDQLVEREPFLRPPGIRQRAEASALLMTMLAEQGVDVADDLRTTYPFLPDAAAQSPSIALITRGHADAERIAQAIESNSAPAWLIAAQPTVDAWLLWYRQQVAPLVQSESWVPDRLEYQFSIGAGEELQFDAPMHEGGALDWFSFDVAEASASAPPQGEAFEHTCYASPLRYAGMPADRLWQFEDSVANFGRMDVQINDLARLCLIEFAMVYGCDWYLAPLDVPLGSYIHLDTVLIRDNFGRVDALSRAQPGTAANRFALFGNSHGEGVADGLLIPPAALDTHEGAPLEQVNFLRDEMANMGWAVERIVQNAAGDPETRLNQPLTGGARVNGSEEGDLVYRLETGVPENWVPLVPTPAHQRSGFFLRKGTMTGTDQAKGQILASVPFDLMDEELPRSGVAVMRVPSLARDAQGNRIRWTARRVNNGFGEGASNLRFDGAGPV
jgi:hypothetical protein